MNRSKTKELCKIFSLKDNPDVETEALDTQAEYDSDSVTEILKIVSDVQSRVTALESQVKSLNLENEQLKNIITALSNENGTKSSSDNGAKSTNDVSKKKARSDKMLSDNSHEIEVSVDTPDAHLTVADDSDCSSTESDSESEEFQFQTRYKKKLKKLDKQKRNLKAKPTATLNAAHKPQNKDSMLKASDATCDIYIGGLSPSTTVNQVKQHMNSVHIDGEVEQLARKDEYSSFKLTVPMSMKQKTLKSSTWPKGIISRLFRPQRNQTRPARGNQQYLRSSSNYTRQYRNNYQQNWRREKPGYSNWNEQYYDNWY